ncbi:hypothetical protein VZT92_025204 [Zoarces viviparus]|uniref:Uncharacterized protein n=1 Tax=Zoarces viviparus TaxID=48416 RepID=A0AAW1E526_ZOAVI
MKSESGTPTQYTDVMETSCELEPLLNLISMSLNHRLNWVMVKTAAVLRKLSTLTCRHPSFWSPNQWF